jgi:hypothetical protein
MFKPMMHGLLNIEPFCLGKFDEILKNKLSQNWGVVMIPSKRS